MKRRLEPRSPASVEGVALVGALALLVAVALLLAATASVTLLDWTIWRHRAQAADAWAAVEAASAVAMAQLGESVAEEGALPDAYALPPSGSVDVELTYRKIDERRATLDVRVVSGTAFAKRAIRARWPG